MFERGMPRGMCVCIGGFCVGMVGDSSGGVGDMVSCSGWLNGCCLEECAFH